MCVLVATHGWLVHHLNEKLAFLTRNLEEGLYVLEPKGFDKRYQKHKVYKFTKAFYGVKQAPRAWNACLEMYLKSFEFKRCSQNYSVYIQETKLEKF